MYHSITIRNLRAISHLTVEGLRRVNLVVGRNGAGKTTLLEAVRMLDSPGDPLGPARTVQLRPPSSQDAAWALLSLFPGMDPANSLELEGRWGGEERARRLTVRALPETTVAVGADVRAPSVSGSSFSQPTPAGIELKYFPATGVPIVTRATVKGSVVEGERAPVPDLHPTAYLNPAASVDEQDVPLFSRLVQTKRDSWVVGAMRLIEPATRSAMVVAEHGRPELAIDVGLPALLPVSALGSGFGRLFGLLLFISTLSGGVLLVDEIETSLHRSLFARFWPIVDEASRRFGVQIFATTHSDELIRGAVSYFTSVGQEELGLFRIDRREGGHGVAAYDREMQEAVLEAGFEVRG